jgi:hypothetical protein
MQPCSHDCLNNVGRPPDNAANIYWHHPDCPNHHDKLNIITMLNDTIENGTEYFINRGDQKVAVLLPYENYLLLKSITEK